MRKLVLASAIATVGVAVWGAVFVAQGAAKVSDLTAGTATAQGDNPRHLVEAASSGSLPTRSKKTVSSCCVIGSASGRGSAPASCDSVNTDGNSTTFASANFAAGTALRCIVRITMGYKGGVMLDFVDLAARRE